MLRTALLIVIGFFLIAALVGVAANWHTWPLVISAAVLLLGLLFERYVYKPIQSDAPGSGWDRTAERFEDPRSGRGVTVYYNPRTGERRYVAENDP